MQVLLEDFWLMIWYQNNFEYFFFSSLIYENNKKGLGKTIQMITLMALNYPTPNEKIRATLVVCPLSTLFQWSNEIQTKAADTFSVLVYYGQSKKQFAGKPKKFHK